MAGDQPKVLADIADIIMGQSPSGDFVSIQPEGLPLLNGPSEFTNYAPLPVQFTTDPKRIAIKGDLLFCVRGSTTGRMNWSDREYAIGRGLASIRAKLPGTAPAIRGIIEQALPALLPAATGSTFPNVGRLQLEMLPLPEGISGRLASIATVLGCIDDKIELNRRMATTLEEIARAIFRSWFVDFDPVCAKVEGRDIRLPSDIAAVFPSQFAKDGLPEGWNEQPMLDQATWVNGAAYKDMNFSDTQDALPVVKIGELKNGIGEGTKWTNTNLGERYRITDGELLFSWSGSPDTSIDAFLWVHGDAWLNQHIFAVRPNGSASQGLLFAMLKYLKPFLIEVARDKQTTGLGHVTRQDMARLKLCLGTQAVRQAFDQMVEPIYLRLQMTLRESARLSALRDTLLPKLISGELRIKDAVSVVEAA